MATLGDRLVFAAGTPGLAHLPLAVRGAWWYETARGGHGFGPRDSPTAGDLCDDAKGKWTCRRVDLARVHPTHVGKVQPFERFAVGGGEVEDLVVRGGRACVIVKHGGTTPTRKELVIVSWDPATRKLRVDGRAPLPFAGLTLVR
jgi:hypothetical protein